MSIVKRIVCVFVVIVLSCILLTACSHSLSGTYICDEGYSIDFTSSKDCKIYTDKSDRFSDGTYYWDKDDDCYYLEFSNAWIGHERYKAELSGNELTVTISRKEYVFEKE